MSASDEKLGCPIPSISSEAPPCCESIRSWAALLLAAAISFFGTCAVHARPPYPILLVHGIGSDDSTWEGTVSELAQRYKIQAADSLTLHACLNYDANPTINNLTVRRLIVPAPSGKMTKC